MRKPLIMAHTGKISPKTKENSILGILETLKSKKADIIELDVRKSRDNVLFCYHGFPWWKFLAAWFLRFFSIKTVKSLAKVDTLEEIISSSHRKLTKKTILFLDIKDKSVTTSEISKICGKIQCEIWIAAIGLRYLKRMKGLKGVKNRRFKLVYNFGFLRFKRGANLASSAGIDIIKVFPWNLNEKNVKLLRKLGLRFAVQETWSTNRLTKKLSGEWTIIPNTSLHKTSRPRYSPRLNSR